MSDYEAIEIVQSPTQSVDLASNVWKRFRRHRGAIAGAITLGIIVALSLFAFLSPYDPEKSNLKTMEGLDNLGRYPVNIMTNTVLTKANYHEVVPLLSRVSAGPVSETHLWKVFPMESTDRKDLLVSVRDCRDLLWELIPVMEPAGKPLILKNIPECLVSGEFVFLDNGFPVTLIGETYWNAFDQNRFGICYHREACGSRVCWGLKQAHVQKYGDERDILSPIVDR